MKDYQAANAVEIDGRTTTEANDDAEARMVDEWAEKLMARSGVPRIYAQRCAMAVVMLLKERDARCAKIATANEDIGLRQTELLEGLREIGMTIYNARKRGVSAGALILATGMTHPDFDSARALGSKQSVSPELTANAVEEWQERLRLPRTSTQKSVGARKTYKDTNGKMGATT